jgi:hypothetical protein
MQILVRALIFNIVHEGLYLKQTRMAHKTEFALGTGDERNATQR